MLISWADAAQDPRLAGDAVGLGGSTAEQLSDGPAVYVTGQVELDPVDIAATERSTEGRQTALDIVLHELGHVVGLAHVTDPTQVMNPSLTHPVPAGYGVGDRAGLALLGRGARLPSM